MYSKVLSLINVCLFLISKEFAAELDPLPEKDLMRREPGNSGNTNAAMRMETEVNVISLNCW